MTMSVEGGMTAINFETLTAEQATQLLGNAKTARSEIMALEALLRKDGIKAVQNPKLQNLMKQLGLMTKGKNGWTVNLKFMGTGGVAGLRARLRSMRQGLSQLMQGLEGALSKSGGLPQAAAQQYGADTGAEIDQILQDPSLSLEEKLMMLSSTLAAKLENDINQKMDAWAKSAAGTSGSTPGGAAPGASGASGMFNTIASVAMQALLPPGVGQAAAGLVGQAMNSTGGTSAGDKASQSRQLETQIQLLMQRMNRMTTMVSNLMADDHKTKSAVIANTRV